MPGFDPVVDPDRGATVNVQQQRPAPTIDELTRAESLAVVEAEKYYRDQGFPTFEEAQQQVFKHTWMSLEMNNHTSTTQ